MPNPAKPTPILQMEGGYRPDRHAKRVDTLAAGTPQKPKHFGKDESEVWDRVLNQWRGTTVLGAIDTSALVACCEMWALYRQAVKAAVDEPTDKEARCAVTGYLESFNRLASKFGMNPSDRANMKGTKETPKDENEAMFG